MNNLENPIMYKMKASSNPDIFYMYKTMRELDVDKFKQAMIKEARMHAKKKHWKIIEKKGLPKGTIILPAMWSMRRK